MDATPFQEFQPPFDQFLVHAETGQTVHHPSAGFEAGIEDGDGIAFAGKRVGRYQAADAGTDDGNGLVFGRLHGGSARPCFQP